MGTFQVGLLLIGTFALLLALSVPVSVSIIISSVVTMASTLSLDLGTFVASQRMVGGVDSFSLLAVPFYILCGVLMNTGGIAQKLIDFTPIVWATRCSALCPVPPLQLPLPSAAF